MGLSPPMRHPMGTLTPKHLDTEGDQIILKFEDEAGENVG
jgi:hypothetical protein